ncbi:hypothetical protein BDV93DRAFT_563790 [Ceratobasidium sp. AG-I]|nr:hypothetical protein BDV93DRAFT_563790 [Ceratobasidium sp. AG-I]
MALPTVSNVGPADTDPLTEDELSILLAIPRAARNSPHATLFRLPRGPDPTLGWVDVTCAQVESIVSRLASRWSPILSGIIHARSGGRVSSVGPGTTICILVQPALNALFHHLAFWSLGCTIQYTMLVPGEDIASRYVQQAGCHIALCSEDDLCTRAAMEQLGIAAHTPPWPEPRRPSPAVIIQSSASTGDPKLMRFSLHYYTLGLAWNCQRHLESSRKNASESQSDKQQSMRPRLVLIPPYWQSFYRSFFAHLVTATPIAFAHTSDTSRLSGAEIAAWLEGLQAGALVASAHRVREVAMLGTHTKLLQNLSYIATSGSRVDQQTSNLFHAHGLKVTNIFGTSELGRLLYASHVPYTHLRPFPDVPPPLVFPVTATGKIAADTKSDEQPGRKVQLWSSLSTCIHLAHLSARGGVSLNLEPLPGKGPQMTLQKLGCN